MPRSLFRRFALALAAAAATLSPFVAWAQANGSYALQNPIGGNPTICSLLEKVLQIVLYLGVPVAILFLVLVGFRFVMARGNDMKLKAARESFLYTVVGIVIFFGAALITELIINTLQDFDVTIGSCNTSSQLQYTKSVTTRFFD